ncbi:MAG: prepilin peptidase [Firmicutes bacterium]|nr:prepilin peptidase [Bacillota bacterium]NSW89325.1 prepilin peptidase [Bacillota bacterium]
MVTATVFIMGLVVGSFLNVCIYRIPRRESVVAGASHCPDCGRKIKWYDMVPVLSYILLKGRCRFCKNRISLRYPVVEFLNGITWLTLHIILGLSVWFVLSCIVVSCMYVIFFMRKDKTMGE